MLKNDLRIYVLGHRLIIRKKIAQMYGIDLSHHTVSAGLMIKQDNAQDDPKINQSGIMTPRSVSFKF